MTNPFVINVINGLEEDRNKQLSELIAMECDIPFLKARLAEGYTQVQFGSGKWQYPSKHFARLIKSSKNVSSEYPGMTWMGSIGAIRLVSVWVVFHPKDRIYTYIEVKLDAAGWHHPGPKLTRLFRKRSVLYQFIHDFEIEFVPATFDLKELVEISES